MNKIEYYSYEKGHTTIPKPCPGFYCGRIYSNGIYSGCGPCPWGYRANLSICHPCDTELPVYDSFYLVTVVLVTVLLHFYFIDKSVKLAYRKKPQVMVLYLSAIVESSLSVLVSMFLYSPFGSLKLTGCGVKQLSDFYTVFKNPRPNYEEKLHCTQEAAYPIYSIVLIYICLSVLAICIIRIPVVRIFRIKRDSANSIYAAFYFFPIMAAFYAVFAGYLYYSYPILILIGAVVSTAWFLASRPYQEPKMMLVHIITSPRLLIILVGHWLITSFGILSVSELNGVSFTWEMLTLVSVPLIFYLMTLKLTDPSKFHSD